MARSAQKLGRAFRTSPLQDGFCEDADARRLRTDMDAIRARYPDHA
jgi:hypothetical protein